MMYLGSSKPPIMKKYFTLLALAACLHTLSYAQTIKTPPPSTPQTVRQDFGLSSIELSYSRPNVRGRKIFGDLVPFGKVWRTGANQATTLTFGDPVNIGGTTIPAGKYGLLTNPGAYKEDQDVVRIPVKPEQLPFSMETFTIMFADVTANSCELQILWDNVFIHVPITTDIDTRVMTQIDDALNKDSRPYFTGALYYLDNGKDLNKALEWFDKAIAQNPNSFPVYYHKARCLAKLGKKQEAVSTAKKGIEMAQKANNADYVALNEKLIASLQ